MLKKIKIETELWMDDTLETEENIKEQFEDFAWEMNRKPTQPSVKITNIDEEVKLK